MNEKEMSIELANVGVDDNPYDLLFIHILDMLEQLESKNLDQVSKKVDAIQEALKQINKLSADTSDMCLKTSSLEDCRVNGKLRSFTTELKLKVSTKYNSPNPSRNIEYERVRLGEDSAEYKRLLELRKIADESEDFGKMEDFESFCMSLLPFDEDNELLKKYNLTPEEVSYISAYKFGE